MKSVKGVEPNSFSLWFTHESFAFITYILKKHIKLFLISLLIGRQAENEATLANLSLKLFIVLLNK